MSILGRLTGHVRKEELRQHRLMVFEQVFDDYRAGRCPASYVQYRAKKMLAVGLPSKVSKRSK